MLSIYILISLKLFITAVIRDEKNQKFFDNGTLHFSSTLTRRQPRSNLIKGFLA